jgi:hypothetical protein
MTCFTPAILRAGRLAARASHRHLALLRRLLRGHLDVYPANALASPERGFDVALDLLRDGLVAGHNVQGDGDVVVVRDADRLDDAEADDVTAEAGELDALEEFADVFLGQGMVNSAGHGPSIQ